MLTSLLLPTVILIATAIAVARGIEALLPETLGAILFGLGLSALGMWVISALFFAGLYILESPELAHAIAKDGRGIAHLAILGAKSALIWAPVLLLVASTAPRRWKTNTW